MAAVKSLILLTLPVSLCFSDEGAAPDFVPSDEIVYLPAIEEFTEAPPVAIEPAAEPIVQDELVSSLFTKKEKPKVIRKDKIQISKPVEASSVTNSVADMSSKEKEPSPMARSQERVFKYRPLLDKHYWYFNADYLYWRAQQSNLDYAIADAPRPTDIPNLFTQTTAQIGKVKAAKPDWQSGFRVGVGSVFTHDYWDIEADYTYLAPSSGSDTASAKDNTLLYGTINQFTNIEARSASASTSLKYHVADLFLAKRIPLSKQILLRLSVGGVGAWLNHHFNADFHPTAGTPVFDCKTRRHWAFKGAGFKTGVSTDWFFGNGLSLFGMFNFGLLYGDYQNRYFSGSFGTSSGDLAYTVQNNKIHEHRLVYTMQFLLGPSFGWRFDNWGFELMTAYEMNLWYNVQQVLYSDFESGISGRESRYSLGSLGLQGLTVHTKFYF